MYTFSLAIVLVLSACAEICGNVITSQTPLVLLIFEYITVVARKGTLRHL